MPRPKSKNTEQKLWEAIAEQERLLSSGVNESVRVSYADIKIIAELIAPLELTKDQILKKAIHLGLQVLSINANPPPVMADYLPTSEPESFVFEDPNLVVPNDPHSGWQFHGSAVAPPEETE